MEDIRESDRERLFRYARTFGGGISLGTGLIAAYIFTYGMAHEIFRPRLLVISIAGCLFLAWQLVLARHDPNGVFLGLSMMSLNAAIIGIALLFALHPQKIETGTFSSLPLLEQGLIVAIRFCPFLCMLLVLIDCLRRISQEKKSAGYDTWIIRRKDRVERFKSLLFSWKTHKLPMLTSPKADRRRHFHADQAIKWIFRKSDCSALAAKRDCSKNIRNPYFTGLPERIAWLFYQHGLQFAASR
jgi:hypothetical protein